MIKIHCDICGKEIGYYKDGFKFPLEEGWDYTIYMEHLCDTCFKDVNSFISELKVKHKVG